MTSAPLPHGVSRPTLPDDRADPFRTPARSSATGAMRRQAPDEQRRRGASAALRAELVARKQRMRESEASVEWFQSGGA